MFLLLFVRRVNNIIVAIIGYYAWPSNSSPNAKPLTREERSYKALKAMVNEVCNNKTGNKPRQIVRALVSKIWMTSRLTTTVWSYVQYLAMLPESVLNFCVGFLPVKRGLFLYRHLWGLSLSIEYSRHYVLFNINMYKIAWGEQAFVDESDIITLSVTHTYIYMYTCMTSSNPNPNRIRRACASAPSPPAVCSSSCTYKKEMETEKRNTGGRRFHPHTRVVLEKTPK